METRPGSSPRESTEAMVRHIGRELAEIEQAIGRCRGDAKAEAQLTGSWMANLLISSAALLHNLLIDTARWPRRIQPPGLPENSGRLRWRAHRPGGRQPIRPLSL
jgi:hypothetical protein